MAKTEHYFTQFESGKFYHIYNRTIDKGKLFKNKGNYEYFKVKLNEYLLSYVNLYAYCLLGNHFHLLVEILPEKTIKDKLRNFHEANPERILAVKSKSIIDKSVHDIVSHQLKKFFQTYAMAFNKQHERIGTLFQKPFKRAEVASERYLKNLIYYIHANPKLHGIVQDFRTYEWSSYQFFITETPTKIKRTEVFDFFGGKQNFIDFHEIGHDLPVELDLED